jgi:hypothetical protein
MRIVPGKLYMHPQEPGRWVAAHDEITRIASSQDGMARPAPVGRTPEPGRINLFEQGIRSGTAGMAGGRRSATPTPDPSREHPQAPHQLVRAAVLTDPVQHPCLPKASPARRRHDRKPSPGRTRRR